MQFIFKDNEDGSRLTQKQVRYQLPPGWTDSLKQYEYAGFMNDFLDFELDNIFHESGSEKNLSAPKKVPQFNR